MMFPSLRPPGSPGRSWRPVRQARPLVGLLPYLLCGSIGEFGPVHLLDDGSVGFAFELEVPVVDTEVDGEARVSAMIDQALRALPDGVQWQWLVRSSPYVEPALQRYLAQSGVDPLGRACVQQVIQRWRAAQELGFFPDHGQVNFFPSTQSILLALKSPPLGLHPWPALLQTCGQADLRERSAAFIDAASALRGTLSSYGIEAVDVDADRLANCVCGLLFPWRCLERPPIKTGLHCVREAVASQGRIDPVLPHGFTTVCAGRIAHHRVASMLWHPHAVRPGLLNGLMRLRPCLSICVSGGVLPSASATLRLKAQGLLNARSAHRFNEVETQARAQALEQVERRLFAEGERLIEGRLQVHVVEASAEAADAAALAACDLLREADIEATPEEDIGASLILRGCLPFTQYEAAERKFRRRRRFLSRDFADLHPAGGPWAGTAPLHAEGSNLNSPVVMYCNSAGAPLFVDPTKAERNPHALVVGQSGSGKSFFVHDYLLHLWRLPDVRLFLVSIKPDYRKLALLLGRYVDLNLDCGESLNPFGGAPTPENQARWVTALTLMLTEGRGDRGLTREQEIALQEASLAASARNWDATARRAPVQTRLEDVCIELERRAGSVGRDLAFQLLPYRRGPYRKLFNSPRTLASSDRFIFFNLGNILRQPCSAAACFCVFNLIDEVMHDPALRAVPKGLIADEAWALVQNPFAAAILERSLKAYRSLGGFALPIVQDPRDLDTPAGRVMLVNTATKIVLPMDASGHEEIRRFVRLNERELELVRHLRLVKRHYSEFFVSIEGLQSGKGLLIPDPLRYAIATTDPVDEARLEALAQQSGSMLQAVLEFARSTPYGLPGPDVGPEIPAGTIPRGVRGAALIKWLAGLALLAAAATAYVLTTPKVLATRSAAAAAPFRVQPRPTQESAQATDQALRLLGGEPAADPLVEPGSETGAIAARGQALTSPPRQPAPQRSSRNSKPEASADGVDRIVRSPPPALPATIPARIEGGTAAGQSVDPLASMSLDSGVLASDPRDVPLAAIEIRVGRDPPRVRLRSTLDAAQGAAWYEAGDTAAPGWTLVSIDTGAVTLMSTDGHLVHLRPASGADGADANADSSDADR